jgi:hypothetical protein
MDDRRPTPEEEAEWAARCEAVVARLRERWPKRPAIKELTTEVIAAAPDAELDDLVLEFVDTKKPSELTGTDDYAWLGLLPRGVQLMWCSIVVEGELNNGGFNQFFFNGTDALAPVAIAGFEAIGAKPFAAVVNEAIKTARKHAPEVARSWGQGSIDDFMGSYRDEIFKDLDDRFYALYEQVDVTGLRARWMRSHTAELTTG